MPSYATLADVKLQVGKTTVSPDEEVALKNKIPQASELVDSWTGTWWDNRTQTVQTEARDPQQVRLFMPARIVSITSVAESGVALAASDFVVYPHWIEKKGRAPWSTLQLDLTVVGVFGFKTVPPDISTLTAEVAAMLSGLKVRSYTQDDGVEKAVLMTSLPSWAQAIIEARKYRLQVPQRMVVS